MKSPMLSQNYTEKSSPRYDKITNIPLTKIYSQNPIIFVQIYANIVKYGKFLKI
jgi:hypothetical protein